MGLDKLLYLQGVGAEFVDCNGTNITIEYSDRVGILQTMLTDVATPSQAVFNPDFVDQRNHMLDAEPWTQLLPAFQWTYLDEPSIELSLPASFQTSLQIQLTQDNLEVIEFGCDLSVMTVTGDYRIGDTAYLRWQLPLSRVLTAKQRQQLTLGYHQLSIRIADDVAVEHQGQLMLAPRKAWQADECAHDRQWGVSVQLYSLRSEQQWGMGDFADLQTLTKTMAKEGADYILLNPLHALNSAKPDYASPYSPMDRRFLNPLYLHIPAIEEFQWLSAKQQFPALLQQAKQLNQLEWLDYPAIHRTKFAALELMFSEFKQRHLHNNTARAQSYQQFVQQQGLALLQFAEHEMGLAQASQQSYADSEFFQYLQFLCSEQFQQCQQVAVDAGMKIGLIRDLAVGALVEGSEVQANVEQFCVNASIGAPPDPFAPQGQNWGLTPLDPIKLKQHNYQHFIQLVRANMRHCGALRLDHVMALRRLWWWPLDEAFGRGAYIYYPVETLLAILCLESHRFECRLIGEDLGVVPPEIVSKLFNAGIVSNELFYFCRHHHGFKSPAEYKQQSLMMLANHDVPTLAAWWQGSDIQLRMDMGLLSSEDDLHESHQERNQQKQQLLDVLVAEQVLSCDQAQLTIDIKQLIPALARAVANGKSQLFSLQFCDLAADTVPVNIPGTWKEFPNWQRRLPETIEQIIASELFADTVKQLQQVRHNENDPHSHAVNG
ncbi:4-alpha-glucanotransferase [Alteromonadaceae bacterium BrNp21-10]|nr:4-alpha-glucanotransferase [Alteromonadaceae bacterium BrNp21-10]